MTTGGHDPNENPEEGKPADPYGPPPQGNTPSGNYPPPPPPHGPGGGYPPPPQQPGGYPPPPQQPGGYPPPPPQGGYPPPPGNYPPPPPFEQPRPAGGPGSGQLSVGDAITYGWKKFSENALVWVGMILIAAVISAIIQLIFGSGLTSDGGISVLSVIGGFISTIVGYLIQAALIRGALHEVNGDKPAFGSFFQFSNVAAIIIASLIVGIATTIGFFLLIIPGLVVMFLTWFTLQFVIDQDQQPIDAIKSSFQVISQNAGPLLLLTLALVGINILGAIPCFIGLLITIPMTIIASTYAYRVLTQRHVSPV